MSGFSADWLALRERSCQSHAFGSSAVAFSHNGVTAFTDETAKAVVIDM